MYKSNTTNLGHKISLEVFHLVLLSLSALSIQVSAFTTSHLFCYLPDMYTLLIAVLIKLFFIILQELS